MPRHEVIELMTTLKLAGMRLNYDEIVTAGRRRKRDFEAILCDLLAVEIADKKARSIRYQEKRQLRSLRDDDCQNAGSQRAVCV